MDKNQLIEGYKGYLSFLGEDVRSQFWAIQLLTFVFAFFVTFISTFFLYFPFIGPIFYFIVVAGALILSVWLTAASTARRCRNAGINPWFTAACFIPYIGLIVLIVIGILPTKDKDIIA